MNKVLSRYISILPLENGFWIVYNSFTDKYVVTRSDEKLTREKIVNYKYLESKLDEIGAFVNSNENESELLLCRMRKVVSNDTIFQLFINPTLNCNFRCWYCYEQHNGNLMMTETTRKSINKFIQLTLDSMPNLKRFSLSFFGGEPFLCFNEIVRPIIEYASIVCAEKEVNLDIHFTTNGFLVTDEIVDFVKKYDNSFQITLDGGREMHDRVRFTAANKGSFNRIISSIIKLAKASSNVVMRINYTRENILSAFTIAESFKDLNIEEKKHIKVDLQSVWQERSDRDICIQERVNALSDSFKNEGFNVSEHSLWNNSYNPCYADFQNQMLVNYDGRVFKCTARDFSEKNSLGYLSENGTVCWRKEMPNLYLSLKMSKQVCRDCRIAPICGSGCCQFNLESKEYNRCPMGYSEKDINDKILKRFEKAFIE